MSDIVRLTVLGLRGATVRVSLQPIQAAGTVLPATRSFALAVISELQPPGWDRAILGATWHQDQAKFVELALTAVRTVSVAGGRHFGLPGELPRDESRHPELLLDIELADETWTRSLEVGRPVGSTVYPQPLQRARWPLCPGAPSAKDCLATLRNWLPKGDAPVALDEAQRASLATWLFHPSDGVPKVILAALPRLGPTGGELLGRVFELARDFQFETCIHAMACLAALDDPAAADVLLTLAGAEWPADVLALVALGRLSRRSPAVDALLLEFPSTAEREQTLPWTVWRVSRAEDDLVRWLDATFPLGKGLYLTRYTPPAEAPLVAARIVDQMRARLGTDPALLDAAEPVIKSTAKDLGASGKALLDALRVLRRAK